MSKLKELLEGKELPVNVCRNEPLIKHRFYTISHKNENYALATFYYKENKNKVEDCFLSLSTDNWELCEEPKKKVKVALYAYKRKGDKYVSTTCYMYKNDQHVIEALGNVTLIKRLDFSEIEVDDE